MILLGNQEGVDHRKTGDDKVFREVDREIILDLLPDILKETKNKSREIASKNNCDDEGKMGYSSPYPLQPKKPLYAYCFVNFATIPAAVALSV